MNAIGFFLVLGIVVTVFICCLYDLKLKLNRRIDWLEERLDKLKDTKLGQRHSSLVDKSHETSSNQKKTEYNE